MRTADFLMLLLVPVTMGFRAEDHVRSKRSEALAEIGHLVSSNANESIAQLGRSIDLDVRDMPKHWRDDPPDFVGSRNYMALWLSSNRSTCIESAFFHFSNIDSETIEEYIEINLRPTVCLRLSDLIRTLRAKIRLMQIPIADSLKFADPSRPPLLQSADTRYVESVEVDSGGTRKSLNGIRTRKSDGSAAPSLISETSNDCIATFNIESEPPLPVSPVLFKDDPREGIDLK
jgi:hypothetical protein